MQARSRRVVVVVTSMALLAASMVAASTSFGPTVGAIDVAPVPVTASVETAPVAQAGDAADDPAIWRDPSDPSRSLVIGNNKQGSLDVTGIDGALVQRYTTATTFWGNVDVRQGVVIGGVTRDVIAAYNAGLRLFGVNPQTRHLELQTDGAGVIKTGGGEGLCLYRSRQSGEVSAIVITIAGHVRQYVLNDADADGLLEGTLGREFDVGSEAEGCVADDSSGALYISEERVGLWRYDAEPTAGTSRTLIDAVQPSGRIAPDAEGVTVVDLGGTSGYVVVSAQNGASPNNSYFVAYSRATGAYVGSFRVVSGADVDGCSRTDGIAASTADLGPGFSNGMFVCQDDSNTAPGSAGNQNFKLVPLERVLTALGDTTPPTTTPTSTTSTTTTTTPTGTSRISFVAGAASNGNRVAHTVRIPDAVSAGDTLLAFFGSNTNTAVTAPAGWTEVANATESTVVGKAWTRTATSTDAGSTLRVTTAAIAKSDLSVVAYRGAAVPAVGVSGSRVQVGGSGAHVTPTATSPDPALVVSYWADKSGSAVPLTVGPPQVVRASSIGTGGGRIAAAVADSGAVEPAGTIGGVTATGTSATSRSMMFTVALRVNGTTPPPTNQPPVAAAEVSCSGAVCSFDGGGSEDADGSIVSHVWDFGDGHVGEGVTIDHTYTSAGPFTATLRVTDDDGATSTASVAANPVIVTPPAATPTLVGAVSSNDNRLAHSVRLPSSIRAGDTLLAFFGSNSAATISAPAGWTQLDAQGDSSIQGRLWSRTATEVDAGATVTATTATYAKADLTVLVYRGGDTQRIVASGGKLDRGGAAHVTPTLASAVPALAVSYWSDKSGNGTALSVPAPQIVRASTVGTGGGRIVAAASDSGVLSPAGRIGGVVATGTATSSRTVSFTVLLAGA